MEPLSPPRNAGISKPPKLCHVYKIVHGLTDFPGAPTEQQQFRFHQFHLAFSHQNPSKTDPELLSMCNYYPALPLCVYLVVDNHSVSCDVDIIIRLGIINNYQCEIKF